MSLLAWAMSPFFCNRVSRSSSFIAHQHCVFLVRVARIARAHPSECPSLPFARVAHLGFLVRVPALRVRATQCPTTWFHCFGSHPIFWAPRSCSRTLFLGPCCLFLVRAFASTATRRFAPHDNREYLCPLYWQKLWSLGVSIQDEASTWIWSCACCSAKLESSSFFGCVSWWTTSGGVASTNSRGHVMWQLCYECCFCSLFYTKSRERSWYETSSMLLLQAVRTFCSQLQ